MIHHSDGKCKRILLKAASLTASAAMLMAVSGARADTYWVICNEESYVNIRSQPSTKASVEGRLYCGESIDVDGTRKDNQGRTWMHYAEALETENGGWVMADYLVSSEVEAQEWSGVIFANGRVAIRNSPGGTRTGWAKSGDKVKVTVVCGDWALTEKGYISMDYIRRVEETDVP